MNDYDLVRRCDVLEILDYEGFLGRTRKLVEQLVAVTPEAKAAEIEWYRDRVVWGYYEDETPKFYQGKEGEHEICEPVSAKEVTCYVNEIERLRGDLAKAVEALKDMRDDKVGFRHEVHFRRRAAVVYAELTVSATVKDYLTPEDEKQSHEWKCPIDYPGCRKNCGSQYGCKN